MSTLALPAAPTMPYALGALVEIHFHIGDRIVVLATVEDTHEGTALTVRTIAEWNLDAEGLTLDTRGDDFTIFPSQLADGSTTIRVVQPEDIAR